VSKLLIVGLGPLFEHGVRYLGAQCLRTWCFVEPLLRDGHTVRLVTMPTNDPRDVQPALIRLNFHGLEYQSFTNCDFPFIHETLTQVARSFAPDAMIGVNNLPAWIVARLPLCVPMWADLYGYQMAEKQGQAARTHDDDALVPAWKKEALTARRADKFSTVSRPQLHALLGEMASLGRLNQHTFRYHFVHHIPASFHPAFASQPVSQSDLSDSSDRSDLSDLSASRSVGQSAGLHPPVSSIRNPQSPIPNPQFSVLSPQSSSLSPLLRGRIVPPDAFVLLWSGGYNFWTDPDFLFEFISAALHQDARIHYVSTGGALEGYNTQTYERFQNLVEKSDVRDRCHLLGWVPAEDLPGIYREADLAINIDEPNYETLFGARTRVNNLMAAGVPVLTTFGSEVSQAIAEGECGIVCPGKDAQALAAAVRRAVEERAWLRELGEKARIFALREWAPEKVTEPLRKWAQAPAPAPDNAVKLRENPGILSFLEAAVNELERNAALVERHGAHEMRRDQVDFDTIRSKRWYKILKRVAGW
jgi:glycosyltransferase involved in cell wall biosynthesis